MRATEVSRQTYTSVMGRKFFISGIAVICLLIVACVAVVAVSMNLRYSPPPIDDSETEGMPIVEENYLYKEINSDFGYTFYMAVNLFRKEDGGVDIYLTNPQDNKVSLMCEIEDADSGRLYYKSGRIRPGCYIQDIDPQTDFENVHHDVRIHIYAFEQGSYLSAGTTELMLSLQPW